MIYLSNKQTGIRDITLDKEFAENTLILENLAELTEQEWNEERVLAR